MTTSAGTVQTICDRGLGIYSTDPSVRSSEIPILTFYIQFDFGNIGANWNVVTFSIGSIELGEGFQIYGSNQPGELGNLLYTSPWDPTEVCLFNATYNCGKQYRYMSITAFDIGVLNGLGGNEYANVLASSITFSSSPVIYNCAPSVAPTVEPSFEPSATPNIISEQVITSQQSSQYHYMTLEAKVIVGVVVSVVLSICCIFALFMRYRYKNKNLKIFKDYDLEYFYNNNNNETDSYMNNPRDSLKSMQRDISVNNSVLSVSNDLHNPKDVNDMTYDSWFKPGSDISEEVLFEVKNPVYGERRGRDNN